MKFRTAAKRGLTLIELVVVMAILGVLAAVLLPKFDGLQKAADHVAAATSTTDAAKLIQSYYVAKNYYPNYWDSLLNGSALWNAGSVGAATLGLDAELTGSGTTTDKIVLGPALQANQVTAFSNVGITQVLTVNTSSTSGVSRPGDMFLTPTAIATGLTLATINTQSTGGIKIINHIYRSNLQTGSTLSGTINPTGTAGDTQLIVFGLGPQNSLVGNSMIEPPTYGEVNAQYIYNRLLVVFELTGFSSSTASSSVTFKAVLGADGDLLDDMAASMQKVKM